MDGEPLPLISRKYRESGCLLTIFHDPLDGPHPYALMKMCSPLKSEYFSTELANLKKIRHRHTVQFVKSYRRGKDIGMLFQPAETTDLQRILNQGSMNVFTHTDNSAGDSRRTYPIILTAFGCLSQGLACIHRSNVTHGNIEPACILYEGSLGMYFPLSTGRFLWTGFSRAIDLNRNSVNRSRHHRLYASPEILAMSPIDGVSEINEASEEEYAEYLDWTQPEDSNANRSADIFAFGCVMLEILSVLVGEDCSPLKDRRLDFVANFGANLKSLHSWIERQIESLEEERQDLEVIFRLGMKMTDADPKSRPLIGEIVKKLNAAGSKYFCEECWEDLEDEVEMEEGEVYHAHEATHSTSPEAE